MAHINYSRQVVGVYFRPEKAVQSAKDGCFWVGGEASDGSGTMWVRYLPRERARAERTLLAGMERSRVVQGRHQGGNLVFDLPHEEWGYDCYHLTGFVNLVSEQEALDWANAQGSDWLEYAKEEERDYEPLLPGYTEPEPEPEPDTHPDLTARDWAIRVMTRLMGAMTTGKAESIPVPCGYVCVDEQARFLFTDRDGQPLRATMKRGAVDNVTLKKLEAMLEELAAKG